MNHRFGLWIATATMAVVGVTGCATKNWVKTQTAPINDHTGQLEDKTAANGRAIKDTDKNDSDIWMASWDGTQEIQLTSSPDSES